MEDFNLTGLGTEQLNEIYFKVKKLMEIKRAEYYELNMKMGCLIATIDIERSKTRTITPEEQLELMNTYNLTVLQPSSTYSQPASTDAEPVSTDSQPASNEDVNAEVI